MGLAHTRRSGASGAVAPAARLVPQPALGLPHDALAVLREPLPEVPPRGDRPEPQRAVCRSARPQAAGRVPPGAPARLFRVPRDQGHGGIGADGRARHAPGAGLCRGGAGAADRPGLEQGPAAAGGAGGPAAVRRGAAGAARHVVSNGRRRQRGGGGHSQRERPETGGGGAGGGPGPAGRAGHDAQGRPHAPRGGRQGERGLRGRPHPRSAALPARHAHAALLRAPRAAGGRGAPAGPAPGAGRDPRRGRLPVGGEPAGGAACGAAGRDRAAFGRAGQAAL